MQLGLCKQAAQTSSVSPQAREGSPRVSEWDLEWGMGGEVECSHSGAGGSGGQGVQLTHDSENLAVTLSALLASLNSCCNPWIYMAFSRRLWQHAVLCGPCSWTPRRSRTFGKEDSDSSVRRSTLFTRVVHRSPTCSPTIYSPGSAAGGPLDTRCWNLQRKAAGAGGQ
ncbi:arg8-vasotocin receptor-like [Arapaima gigas]